MIPAKVSIQKINELLNEQYVRMEEPTISTVILDLNSTFNTICSIDKESLIEYGSAEYIKQVGALLQSFIKRHTDKKIIVLYNTKPTYLKEHLGSKYLEFFYENRPVIADKIIEHYVKTLEIVGEKTTVNVVNCGKFEPSILVMYHLMRNTDNTLVVSRSRLILQLISEGGYFWDGTFMYNKKVPYSQILSYTRTTAKNKFPKDLQYMLYPYYLCMRGIPSHKYVGVVGYGEKRTTSYLLNHMKEIIKLEDKTFNYNDADYIIPLCFIKNKVEKYNNIKTAFNEVTSKMS